MTHRDWKKMENDEIFAIWNQYLRHEGLVSNDQYISGFVKTKPMRLTPMEIIKLVDELLDRLEVKNG